VVCCDQKEAMHDVGDTREPEEKRPVPSGYDDLIALANDVNRPLESVYVLTPHADPWLAARAARLEAAQWFVDIYRRFELKAGMHLRRIHYMLVSQAEPIKMVDGSGYENTEKCWHVLMKASRDARYLDMLPPLSFVDQRAPDPLIFVDDVEDNDTTSITVCAGEVESRGGLYTYDGPSFKLPFFALGQPRIGQPYHIEVWVEKSTVLDVLEPIAEGYGANVIQGVGHMTLTSVEELVARIRRSGRPVRILYLSDFDPAGQKMPVAVARKVEYLIRNEEMDIQLEPIALTHQQCIDFQLPRTPIKEDTRGLDAFEARYGEGATELDALEALHPGALRRIVIENIERFYDSDLRRNVAVVERQIRREMDRAAAEVRALHSDEIAALEEERRILEEEVEEKLDQLRELIDARENDLTERIEALLETMEEELQEREPDPDAYEWPSPAEGDEFAVR